LRNPDNVQILTQCCAFVFGVGGKMKIRLASLAIGLCGLLLISSGAAADWMLFAVDGKGHFGHGVSSEGETAIHFALSNCGNLDCKPIEPYVNRGCMALSQSFYRGYIVGVGTAPTAKRAREFALNFCAERRPASTCKVNYSYCLPPKPSQSN
jgi:Domain of unknown function (DUF4189)